MGFRKEWDTFLVLEKTPMASRIPDGWVIPEPPSSAVWASTVQPQSPCTMETIWRSLNHWRDGGTQSPRTMETNWWGLNHWRDDRTPSPRTMETDWWGLNHLRDDRTIMNKSGQPTKIVTGASDPPNFHNCTKDKKSWARSLAPGCLCVLCVLDAADSLQ